MEGEDVLCEPCEVLFGKSRGRGGLRLLRVPNLVWVRLTFLGLVWEGRREVSEIVSVDETG